MSADRRPPYQPQQSASTLGNPGYAQQAASRESLVNAYRQSEDISKYPNVAVRKTSVDQTGEEDRKKAKRRTIVVCLVALLAIVVGTGAAFLIVWFLVLGKGGNATAAADTSRVNAASSSSSVAAAATSAAAATTTKAPAATTTSAPWVSKITPGPAGPFTIKVSCPAVRTQVQPICVKPGQMALTFDDGPWMYTDQMLDVLTRLNIKATFFLNGQNVERKNTTYSIYQYNSTVRRIVDAGHQIGGHTWSHTSLLSLNAAAARLEVTRLDDALAAIIGVRPTFFRPPYGDWNQSINDMLGQVGYRWSVMWNVDPFDWQSATNATILAMPPDQAAQTAAQANLANSRAQILLPPANSSYIHLSHDVWPYTVAPYTEMLVTWLRSQGWTDFVTLAECLGETAQNAYRPA